MLIDMILIVLATAIFLTIMGFIWKEIGFTVLGAVGWIVCGLMMFGAEGACSTSEGEVVTYPLDGTVPIAMLFAGIGLVISVMVIREALEVFKKSAGGG